MVDRRHSRALTVGIGPDALTEVRYHRGVAEPSLEIP
jgi:hypothetical protein